MREARAAIDHLLHGEYVPVLTELLPSELKHLIAQLVARQAPGDTGATRYPPRSDSWGTTVFDLPSQQLPRDVTREIAYRAGYKWALVDAGAVILSHIRHSEAADEQSCLLALMKALREMGVDC